MEGGHVPQNLLREGSSDGSDTYRENGGSGMPTPYEQLISPLVALGRELGTPWQTWESWG